MSDEEVLAAMQCSYERYAATRRALGIPLKVPAKDAVLPPWVLRKGEVPKTEWVMRRRMPKDTAVNVAETQAATAEQVVQPMPQMEVAEQSTEQVQQPEQQQVEAKPESWAARVRAVIRNAKSTGQTPQQVLKHVIEVMGMKETSARNCVKANWDRA